MTSGGRAAPFPFIVACGRSGTTLLRAMLERGGDIAIPPESYFPVSLEPRHGRGPFDPTAFTKELRANVRFREWGVPAPDLSGAGTYADGVRAVYATYAEAHDAERYGDKTPPFVLHMDLLAGMFPEARFVHLIRDARDVARSLVQTSFGPSGLARAAHVWARRVFRGRAAGSRIGPGRYLEARYEDLVADPAAVLSEVCAFVELGFRDEMLRPEEGTTWVPERERPHHANLAKPVTADLRDWRRDMPAADVALVEAVAGELLSDLGYERRFPRVPAAARARAAASRVRSAVIRTGRRTARSVRTT
jgi:sulfotransferase family protein